MGYYKNLAIEQEERAMGITEEKNYKGQTNDESPEAAMLPVMIEPKNGEIKYIKQNIADVQRGVIAHGCNYVGVMGAGVAKALADKHSRCFTEYAMWLQDSFPNRKDALGLCNIVWISGELWIANCITQGLAYYDGQMATPEAIRSSLEEAFEHAALEDVPLYLPKIGSGLGGLDWNKDVEPIVSELASKYDEVDTYVCIYP